MERTKVHWGPDTWTENREDGIVKSIDVIIKGWKNENIPTFIKHSHIEDSDDHTKSLGTQAMEHINIKADGQVEESFNWIVPDDCQTSYVHHHHQHPHDVENDQGYLVQLNKWFDLIPQEVKFQAAISKVNKALGDL